MSTASSATAAELSAAADAIGGYRSRVGDLVAPYLGTERDGQHDDHHDDLVSAIYEAERALRTAERLLQRALKIAGR